MTKDWRHNAACGDKDPELFFPSAGEKTVAGRVQYDAAKAVCGSCLVVADCLAYALTEGLDSGVFGGKSPAERRESLNASITSIAD